MQEYEMELEHLLIMRILLESYFSLNRVLNEQDIEEQCNLCLFGLSKLQWILYFKTVIHSTLVVIQMVKAFIIQILYGN